MKKITEQELIQAAHPNESSRFTIAVIVCIPVAILALWLTFVSLGIILFYLGLIIFFVWFFMNILKANLIGNSVEVSKLNFPEIYKVYEDVRETLQYEKNVPIYIIQGGDVNAFIAKFFKTKFIILNSKLVEDMSDENVNITQMRWIIARFIGALKAKKFRTDLLRIIVDTIEKIKIFNLFILPYERATQYTGDNIGLLVCEDVEQAFIAFDKFMVGNVLAKRVNFEGIVEQGKDIKGSFFAFMARIGSTHPPQVKRYLNLLAYSRKKFPEQFEKFISKYGNDTTLNIGYLLPNYN